ncbi:hypothetical protein EMMF5_006221 [Cystobasidiomycetes sp. EMM_F5]
MAAPTLSARATPADAALPLFARGVLDLLASWPALRLARTHGWSARRSNNTATASDGLSDVAQFPPETPHQKQTRFAEELVDAYYSAATTLQDSSIPSRTSSTHPPTSTAVLSLPDKDQLEDFLLDFFEYEYGVGLEDGSEVQVVKDLNAMWDECMRAGSGHPSFSDSLLERFARLAQKAASEDRDPTTAYRGTRTGEQDDGDDDDSESDESGDDAFVQGDGMDVDGIPPLKEKQEPTVDDDGFTMVSSRKGHRR